MCCDVDAFNPDYERHPLFHRVKSWEVVELNPGDVLFIPAFWLLGSFWVQLVSENATYHSYVSPHVSLSIYTQVAQCFDHLQNFHQSKQLRESPK